MTNDLAIITQWIELDYIQYMIMASVLLGVMKLLKQLVMRG